MKNIKTKDPRTQLWGTPSSYSNWSVKVGAIVSKALDKSKNMPATTYSASIEV